MDLVEQKGLSLSEIARQMDLSSTTTCTSYRKSKRKQQRLYLNAICDHTGMSQQDRLQLRDSLEEQYNRDDRLINAWLEQNYMDILDTLREGQLPSGYDLEKVKPYRHGPFTQPKRVMRTQYKDNEWAIFQCKDQEGLSDLEIGTKFGISEHKAHYAYRTAKQVQYYRHVQIISEKTGKARKEISIEAEGKQYPSRLLSARIAYLREAYPEIIQEAEMLEPL